MKKHMQQQNRLWDYQIQKQLGRGEYGQVFQVKSKKNNQIYALKKINLAGAHEKQKIQAFRQIKALKLIHHPNIIEYYESFLSMDNIYIVTQYADKGDMLKEIKIRLKKQKKFTEEELWDIMMTLVQGIKHLHEKNIVHRDIKVQNIFQTIDGKYKVGDLGMSKIVYQASDLISTRVGTPIYFAPQVIQHRLYTFPVDIWALGCVFYYMAALQHPFKDATIETLGYYIIDKQIRPIKGPYSAQLISFIMTMLDKNPQSRPTIYQIHKKLKQRKEQKINNKVSIFNIKQILSLRNYRDLQVNLQKDKSRNKKKQQQIQSPLLLSHNRSLYRPNPQSSLVINLQDQKKEARNMSLILPKKSKLTLKQPNSPMIKSNGFSMNVKGNSTTRYQSAFSSPAKKGEKNQSYLRVARARKVFVAPLN